MQVVIAALRWAPGLVASEIISAGLYDPSAIAVDSAGRVYVADNNNHRVLVFTTNESLALGQPALMVLGHPNAAMDIATRATATPGMGFYVTSIGLSSEQFTD